MELSPGDGSIQQRMGGVTAYMLTACRSPGCAHHKPARSVPNFSIMSRKDRAMASSQVLCAARSKIPPAEFTHNWSPREAVVRWASVHVGHQTVPSIYTTPGTVVASICPHLTDEETETGSQYMPGCLASSLYLISPRGRWLDTPVLACSLHGCGST